MPIYEYECNDCHEQFQAMRRITDESLPDCARCGSPHVTKLISRTSFQLKGSGWYLTDYARKNGPASMSGNGSAKDKPAESPCSSCGSADTCPAKNG
jgi:putative FmdB family regulatory protein